MGFKLLTVLVAAALMNFCSPAIPPNIKLCPRSNPKMAECVKSSIEALRINLKNGQIAPGFTVEALDPMYVGDIVVQNGLNLKLYKLKAFGASNFKIDKIRVNVEKIKIEALLSVPNIMVKGGYSLNWQVSLLNLQGKGDVVGYLDNVKILVRLTGNTYQKGGVDYVKIDDVKVDIKPASLKVRFDNLFNGQKELEDVGNEVINQNIAVIQNDVIPQVERAIERKFLQIVNQVFSKASAAEFFPQ